MILGKISNEPIDVYHATDAVSKSKLDDFRRQPRYFFRKYIEKSVPKDEHEAGHFVIGHSSHTLVLEGQPVYESRYIVVPENAPKMPTKTQINAKNPSAETVEAIRYWEAFRASAGERMVLSNEEDRLNKRIAQSVWDHPVAQQLLDPLTGQPEISWRVKLNHFTAQCRSDWFSEAGCELTNGRPYVVDFKTVASLDPSEFGNFERNFFSYGYYRQAPFYSAVISEAFRPIEDFFFVVTEKKEPFETVIFRPTPRAMNRGWIEVKEDLVRLNECFRDNHWPGAPSAIQPIDVPDWYEFKQSKKEAAG